MKIVKMTITFEEEKNIVYIVMSYTHPPHPSNP